MTVRELWVETRKRLAGQGIADASLEAEVLVRRTTGVDRAQFFATLREPVSEEEADLLDLRVRRRLAGEPLAYIVGDREFYGLDIEVSPAVLIPRQETELLVSLAVEYTQGKEIDELVFADVGTGSGAVAAAIASELPAARVYATDISHEALEVAGANLRNHGVSDRVQVVECDLLEGITARIDVVVSNPPYLRTGEIAALSPEVRNEPRSALDGGASGLDVIARLFRQAYNLVRDGGRVMVEIAPEQLDAVRNLARQAMPAGSTTFERDLMGQPRVVIVDLPERAGRQERARVFHSTDELVSSSPLRSLRG